MNATMRTSSLRPARLTPGALDTLTFDLHFTTWTVRPEHRVRLAIANAQFPMLWPTPYTMTSTVVPRESWVALPVAPVASTFPPPRLPMSDARAARPGVRWGSDSTVGPVVERDARARTTSVRWRSESEWWIDSTRFDDLEEERYRVADSAPARASFLGRASRTVTHAAGAFQLVTEIAIQGERDTLDVRVTRILTSAGATTRRRVWHERIPRRWH